MKDNTKLSIDMERKCLVMMPISDPEGYSQGHFNRVYEYIITPACKAADFTPSRVDVGMMASGDALDVIKSIIESDIAICDLSSNNQNVAYGFVVRNALNLPVVLIKDLKTRKITISDDTDATYDESLRIDTVQTEISALTDSIRTTYSKKSETHPLLSQMWNKSIGAKDSVQGEEEKDKESKLPIISPLPDYVGEPITSDDIDKLKIGDFIFHMTRGKGKITSLKNSSGGEKIAGLTFDSGRTILVLGTSGYFRKVNE